MTDQDADATYRCDIHDFETNSAGQMEQHIDYEHPGGAAKDALHEFEVDDGEVDKTHQKPSAEWDGDHPLSIECNKEGCDSVRMNIIRESCTGDRVVVCAQCGRCNFA